MRHSLLLLTLPACLMMASAPGCKSKTAEDPPKVETETLAGATYPFLGNADISQLYATADHIDIIFYDLPISVNQDNPSSVKNTVLYISPAAPQITKQCKAIARLSWMAAGEIIREADVFIEDGCQYLMFMESNKPAAANSLSQGGIDFFKNIISQVQQQTQ